VDPHKRGTDRKADGRRRRIADNLNKLTEALGELPPGRSSLLMENIGMAMIDADLRAGIMDSGLTHYALAKLSGIAPEQLDRFISGERDLRLGTAAKVAAALGMELKRPSRSTNGTAKTKRAATGKPTKKAR